MKNRHRFLTFFVEFSMNRLPSLSVCAKQTLEHSPRLLEWFESQLLDLSAMPRKWTYFSSGERALLALALGFQVGAPKPSLDLKVLDGRSSAAAREALWIYFCDSF
jgi:hypothetical protein